MSRVYLSLSLPCLPKSTTSGGLRDFLQPTGLKIVFLVKQLHCFYVIALKFVCSGKCLGGGNSKIFGICTRIPRQTIQFDEHIVFKWVGLTTN